MLCTDCRGIAALWADWGEIENDSYLRRTGDKSTYESNQGCQFCQLFLKVLNDFGDHSSLVGDPLQLEVIIQQRRSLGGVRSLHIMFAEEATGVSIFGNAQIYHVDLVLEEGNRSTGQQT